MLTASLLNGSSVFLGSIYLKKYQEESTNVSIVSASLLAGFPQHGQVVFINVLDVVSGDSPFPVNSTSVGNNIGKFSFFSGTIPHSSQYTTGIGHPQYLCLESNQSLNL